MNLYRHVLVEDGGVRQYTTFAEDAEEALNKIRFQADIDGALQIDIKPENLDELPDVLTELILEIE